MATRKADTNGFLAKKDREHDRKKYVRIWRSDWAQEMNLAYKRAGLNITVSHERLEVQGIHDREPTIHLSIADWQRERRGVRTERGNEKRRIHKRNEERQHQRNLRRGRSLELELSR